MKILRCIFYLTLAVCVRPQQIGEEVVELDDPTKFPFFAILNVPFPNGSNGYLPMQCGGSLIHPLWILTAGHCLPNDTSTYDWVVRHAWAIVIMGSIDRARAISTQLTQARRMKKIYRHPDYIFPDSRPGSPTKLRVTKNSKNDVAVLELLTPFEISEAVQPVQLSTMFIKCKFVIAIGIGAVDWQKQHNYSDIVRYAKLPIMNRHVRERPTAFLTNSLMGLVYDYYESPYLRGDSGGPLICGNVSPPLQIGLLSTGYMEKSGTVINVVERVDFFIDFISHYVPIFHLRSKLEKPTQNETITTKAASNARTKKIGLITAASSLISFMYIYCMAK